MMPQMDGLTVVAHLRQEGSSIYILMLTARDALENRVQGLESGADDYLVKPFAPAELVARLHALERRLESEPVHQPVTGLGLTLDPRAHTVHDAERPLELTPTEFALLHTFLRHPRQVLTRAQLLEAVWDYRGRDDNVLEVYVGYLRRKLEAAGQPRRLHTVRGIGYVLRTTDEG
jgi:two-component system response regulator MprA